MQAFLPISIDIAKKQIVIIGGGQAAWHKVKFLKPFTNKIKIVAKDICPELAKENIEIQHKEYEAKDLEKSDLVYACTNNNSLNKKIKNDARAKKLLVNVADDHKECDFISPAIYKDKEMTVAVSSSGKDVKKSIAWRNIIKELFRDDDN